MLAGLVSGASLADARARSDLAVTRVQGPAKAPAGGKLALKVRVTNRGGAAAKASRVVARLGLDGGEAFGGPLGKGRVGPLAPRGSKSVRIEVRIPTSTPAGSWRLTVCVPPGKAKDCLRSEVLTVRDGSSWAVIEAARQSGKLTPGKAILYELYALSGDGRLPRAYRGPGDLPAGSIFAGLVAAYPTLSASEQASLLPYMLQPRYRQSGWAPAGGAGRSGANASAAVPPPDCSNLNEVQGAWKGVETPHAWLWYRPGRPAARARANALAAEFKRTIWPKLTGAFKTVEDSAAAPCDPAGDSKIDIYLVPGGSEAIGNNRGVAPGLTSIGDSCGPFPSFVIIPENAGRSVLAHEFMHVIQWAYKTCERPPAWTEGTATWAEDFVYPKDQLEHEFENGLLHPFTSMLAGGTLDGYDAWTFWYSLSKKDGVAGIKRVYEALAGNDFAGALEAGPSDGLREAWKRYAVQRWNQEPIGPGFKEPKSYKDWDSLNSMAATIPVKVAIGNADEKTFALTTLPRATLSTFFNEATITDKKVRHLEFRNGDSDQPQTVVQAFLKLASGKWRYEDWSGRSVVRLCRDTAEENVVRLIVATSNASARVGPLPPAEHQLTGQRVCKNPPYSGSVIGTASYDETTLGPGNSATAKWSGTVNLLPIETGNNGFPAVYKVDPTHGGTIQYSITGRISDCDMAGQEIIDLSELGTYDSDVLVINAGDPLTYHLHLPMAPGPPDFMVTRSNCADPGLNGPLNWSPGAGQPYIAKSAPDAVVGEAVGLSGSGSGTTPGGATQTWQWNLTPGLP